MSETPEDERAWRYHKDHGAKLFKTRAEVAAADADGWVDSPARVHDAPKPKRGRRKVTTDADDNG